MKRLFAFEMKKIFSSRVVWAGMLLLLLLSFGGFFSMNLSDISYEQEIAEKYQGTLTDDKVQEMLRDFKPTKEQLEQWGGVNVAYIGRNSLQQAVQLYFANPQDGTWNGKTVRDVFGDEEIQVGFHSGWLDFSRNLIKVVMALGILIILMTSSLFAGEYGGMDQILLTCRLGREKCAAAKVLAALTASLIVTVLFLGGNLLAAFLLMGMEGLDSSVLFVGPYYENYIPVNMSCGTMLLWQTALAVSGILMMTGLVIAVSAAARNQFTALAAAALVYVLPAFFSLSESDPRFRVLGLLPIYQLRFSSVMAVPEIGKGIPYALLLFPVSLVTSLVSVILARRFWSGHSVN